MNGEMKAMQRIKNDQFKSIKAAQTAAVRQGFAQAQSTIAHPGVAQPGMV